MCNFADVGIRLRNLKRTPVWHEAFLQTLLIWLEYVSWSSNVTPNSFKKGRTLKKSLLFSFYVIEHMQCSTY